MTRHDSTLFAGRAHPENTKSLSKSQFPSTEVSFRTIASEDALAIDPVAEVVSIMMLLVDTLLYTPLVGVVLASSFLRA